MVALYAETLVNPLRPGKSLEKLVEHIEKALAGSDNITVAAPKRLRDRTTGRLREHDIVIAIKQGHHVLQVAIECRDHSRPITVNQVEGFWKKCDDTGIDQGIIVSTRGFYKTARIKASHLGVRCLDIEEAKSFNWLLTTGIEINTRDLKHVHWTLIPKTEPESKPKDYILVDANGTEISLTVLNENARQHLEKLQLDPFVSGKQQTRFVFVVDNLSILDKSTNRLIPLKELIADAEYEVTRKHIPFDLFKYSDKNLNLEITNAAVAKFESGGIKGRLMFIRQEDQRISLSFIPDNDQS